MIKPTVGRVVHFFPAGSSGREVPYPCFVLQVISDRVIDVAGFKSDGTTFHCREVVLLQDDDQIPGYGPWAQWMPYQKDVAAGKIPPVLHAAPDLGCRHRVGLTFCGYAEADHVKGDGSPMDHAYEAP